eukprot:TRINITY_DN17189_c1_g2_i1.p1 TRINITY_DN17189_c1_g2~~TRINITY_DN17189_c1_g2_i1.p1  ORF type:complete len:320 (-),score=59.64 TRINITY_DN17189_c1_g2_i1:332-1291(-)
MSCNYNFHIPGLPNNFAISLNDFFLVHVSLELVNGRIIDGRLLNVKEGGGVADIVLEDGYGNTIEAYFHDVKSCQFEAMMQYGWGFDYTTEVPVSYVNRLVMVKLPHGKISGLLSCKSLGDNGQLHVEALPGSPAVPPLPSDLIQGVALIPQALFASRQSSGDGKWEIVRHFLQNEEAISMLELQIPTDLPAENRGWYLYQADEDNIIPPHPLDMEVYYNSYSVARAALGPIQYQFIRFPWPLCQEDHTAARSNSFQMRWLPVGMPDLGEKDWFICTVKLDDNDDNDDNDDGDDDAEDLPIALFQSECASSVEDEGREV